MGHKDGRLTVWERSTARSRFSSKLHADEINSLQYIADDTQILTIGDDHVARVWSTADWAQLQQLEGIAFSGRLAPDGRTLGAQDPDQAILIWDFFSKKKLRTIGERGKGGTHRTDFTKDGRYIVTARMSPFVYDLFEEEEIALDWTQGSQKTDLAITLTGEKKAVISVGAFRDDDAPARHVVAARSKPLVAMGRRWINEGFVDVWDLSKRVRLARLRPEAGKTVSSFSYDDSLLAIQGATATVWNVEKKEQIASLQGIGYVEFSPVSLQLAVTGESTLCLYQTEQSDTTNR